MRDRGPSPSRQRDDRLIRAAHAARGAAPLGGKRILVAEDELVIAMDVQDALEAAGAEVVGPASTLEEALELSNAEPLDAAVLDLRLGRHSADRAARALCQRGVPFLFYSGQAASDPERLKWPHVTTVSKPAASRTLVGALLALLERTSITDG